MLIVSTATATADKLETLSEQYRARLKSRAPDLINKWSQQIDITTSGWQVQKMKTKQGNCNIEEG